MKAFERFVLILSLITLLATIAVLVLQWKKDSDIWRSIKRAIEEKEILKLNWDLQRAQLARCFFIKTLKFNLKDLIFPFIGGIMWTYIVRTKDMAIKGGKNMEQNIEQKNPNLGLWFRGKISNKFIVMNHNKHLLFILFPDIWWHLIWHHFQLMSISEN